MVILLVEDDLDLAELVIEYLDIESIECDIAYNGVMGLELVKTNQYDVIVLDVMMPRMDGLTLMSNIRQLGIATPCLMLTARDTLDDKVAGFEHGADDYMVKPFELKELSVRLKALSRRRSNSSSKLQVADLSLNISTHQATRNNQLLALSPIEWKLLEYLMRETPNIVSKQQLESVIWKDELPSKDALKTQLYRLRKAVDGADQRPLIHTIRGSGFVLRENIKESFKENQ
jgi:DNA-binding response OmpR family regulator